MSRIKHSDSELSGVRRSDRHYPGLLAGLMSLAALVNSAGTAARADDSKPLFERVVAPMLSERCAACHNAKKRSGGLDVTSRDSLLKGGDSGPAIVPGKLDEGWLLDMVSGDEPEMPKNSKPLSAEQLADMRKWIGAGAEWPDGVQVTAVLWSLRPIPKQEVPSVKHPDLVPTPIDGGRFRGHHTYL